MGERRKPKPSGRISRTPSPKIDPFWEAQLCSSAKMSSCLRMPLGFSTLYWTAKSMSSDMLFSLSSERFMDVSMRLDLTVKGWRMSSLSMGSESTGPEGDDGDCGGRPRRLGALLTKNSPALQCAYWSGRKTRRNVSLTMPFVGSGAKTRLFTGTWLVGGQTDNGLEQSIYFSPGAVKGAPAVLPGNTDQGRIIPRAWAAGHRRRSR